MHETQESSYCASNPVCDVLRYIGDASFAILPKDIAHKVGEVKKNFWSGVRWLVDKELEWIDNRVAGGDRLREEWRRGATGTDNVAGGS
jgi:hypothetical protein